MELLSVKKYIKLIFHKEWKSMYAGKAFFHSKKGFFTIFTSTSLVFFSNCFEKTNSMPERKKNTVTINNYKKILKKIIQKKTLILVEFVFFYKTHFEDFFKNQIYIIFRDITLKGKSILFLE